MGLQCDPITAQMRPACAEEGHGRQNLYRSEQGHGGHRCEHIQFHFEAIVQWKQVNVEAKGGRAKNEEKENLCCSLWSNGCDLSSGVDVESEPEVVAS